MHTSNSLHYQRIIYTLSALTLPLIALLTLVVLLPSAETPGVEAADAAPIGAHEWIVTVSFAGSLFTIDPTDDTVYGPFLEGQLGSEKSELYDVAITPDGNMALISNYDDSVVYFVDVSNPPTPTLSMSLTVPIMPIDIAISPDGEYAMVTDDGSGDGPVVIDMDPITVSTSIALAYRASTVDIADDGTVIVAGFSSRRLQTLYPDATGQLTVTGVYSYAMTTEGGIDFVSSKKLNRAADRAGDTGNDVGETDTAGAMNRGIDKGYVYYIFPTNVIIAPDQQTVLVCDYSPYATEVLTTGEEIKKYAVGVYQITAPGEITFTGVITDLPRSPQSIAFSDDGTKAYLSGNLGNPNDPVNPHYNAISVLNIDGPGLVSVDQINVAELGRLINMQAYGTDTIAVSGGKAYVGYPSGYDAGTDLKIVNLDDYSVESIDLHQTPMGVAVITSDNTQTVYLPLVLSNN
jgi:hypothetical protein